MSNGMDLHVIEAYDLVKGLLAQDLKSDPLEPLMKHFEYGSLDKELADVAIIFLVAARNVCADLKPGPERTVSLRKLIEARDAALRAKINPYG